MWQSQQVQRGRRGSKNTSETLPGTKAKVGGECCISSGGSNGPSSTVEGYKLEKFKEEVIVLVGVRSPE